MLKREINLKRKTERKQKRKENVLNMKIFKKTFENSKIQKEHFLKARTFFENSEQI